MNKKMKTTAMACALAGVLAIGGISAFFTDADTTTNTFTVGKVEIDLQEPDWVPPTDITPEQEFKKDPQVVNTGINEAYVFVEVTVPYANVITAEDDGARLPKADTELFSYDLKAGWVELEDYEVKDANTKTVKHLYAYAADQDTLTALAAGATSESVFDYVKFANVVEDEGLEEAELDIVVNAYAIQTTNINDGKTTLDGNNADGKISAASVWDVIAEQNIKDGVYSPDYTKPAEETNTDVVK